MSAFSQTANYKPYQITLRQMTSLVAGSTIPGTVTLLEFGPLPPSCLATWSREGQSRNWHVRSWAVPVLSLLVLLALCDRSRHGTLALVDVTDAHPLPVD